jgi:hypothetical protein
MPDIYETDTTRTTWGREAERAPHISDAPHITPGMGEGGHAGWRNRLTWSAIFGGVMVALVTNLLLNLIGAALGAASLAPLTGGGATASSLSTGAGIWFALSNILAALAGGYAAGKFSGAHNESSAGWHGLTTWALSTLLLSYLLSTAASGLLGGLGGAAQSSGATQLAAGAAGLTQMADPFSNIENQLRATTAGNDPAALRDAAIAEVKSAMTASDGMRAAEATERAAQALAKAENVSVENARTQVQGYTQQYRQAVDLAKTEAKQTADSAAKAVSRAALLGALSLILGGLAGWLGGRMAFGDQSFSDRLATASGRARR